MSWFRKPKSKTRMTLAGELRWDAADLRRIYNRWATYSEDTLLRMAKEIEESVEAEENVA